MTTDKVDLVQEPLVVTAEDLCDYGIWLNDTVDWLCGAKPVALATLLGRDYLTVGERVWLTCHVLLYKRRPMWLAWLEVIVDRAIKHMVGSSDSPEWEEWAQRWLAGERWRDLESRVMTMKWRETNVPPNELWRPEPAWIMASRMAVSYVYMRRECNSGDPDVKYMYLAGQTMLDYACHVASQANATANAPQRDEEAKQLADAIRLIGGDA